MPIKPKEVIFEENICFKEQNKIKLKKLKSNGLKQPTTFESTELKGKWQPWLESMAEQARYRMTHNTTKVQSTI